MVDSVNKAGNAGGSFLSRKDTLLNSWYYKTMKSVQGNEVINRGIQDTVTGFVPTFTLELIGRNWKSAIETAVGNGLRIFANYISPLMLVPLGNYLTGKRNKLSHNINGLSKINFEDLTSEVTNEELKARLLEADKNKNQQNINSLTEEDLKSLKIKLLDSKLFVRKLDLLSVGFLNYVTPWLRNIFTKRVLGVSGYVGELDLLSDTEREQSAENHERFKYLKFAGGLLPLLIGTHWDMDQLKKSLTLPLDEVKKSSVLTHFRRRLDEFDYHEGYATGKGNLLRHNLYGGLSSRLLSCRSRNEFIEKGLVRPVVSLIGNFWADTVAHTALAKRHDKLNNTEIIINDKEHIKAGKVKSLPELEKELNTSITEKDESTAEKFLRSIQGQIKTYWQSASISGFITTCAIGFNIWNTKRRVDKGSY